jgi:hypothetical protein
VSARGREPPDRRRRRDRYRHQRRHRQALPPAPAAAPRHLLDRLTSRDGFYVMLSLFVVMGLFRPTLLPGFIVMVAVSSHVYWVARAIVLIVGRR